MTPREARTKPVRRPPLPRRKKSAPAARPAAAARASGAHKHGQLGANERKLAVAIRILSEECKGFGPRAAREYLARCHQLKIGWEMLRKAMGQAGMLEWGPPKRAFPEQRAAEADTAGEFVHWRTWRRRWLNSGGERLQLITMIDEATLTLTARFVRQDSTAENLSLLGSYLKLHGRPRVVSGKPNLFRSSGNRAHTASSPPTRIGKALVELAIGWMPERTFSARAEIEKRLDWLQAELRTKGATTLREANLFLDEFVRRWNRNAPRPDVDGGVGTGAGPVPIANVVELRRLSPDRTVRFYGRVYRIAGGAGGELAPGSQVRIEVREDGAIYAGGQRCTAVAGEREAAPKTQPAKRPSRRKAALPGKSWRGDHGQIARGDTPVWRAAQIDRVRMSDRLD